MDEITPRHVAGPVYEWTLPAPGVVRCIRPDGSVLEVDAFDDGGIRRARVAAYLPGEWQWQAGSAKGRLEVPVPPDHSRWPTGSLRVSTDGRFLTQDDGRPFFYLADTAWLIVRNGTPDEWERYLDFRAAQGYNVIQTMILPFVWDHPDPDGNLPFVDFDVARPNAPYFQRLDRFCEMAAERGFHIFLAIIWGGGKPRRGSSRGLIWGGGKAGPEAGPPDTLFAAESGAAFARYAVSRFAAYPVLWSVSGDHPYMDEPGEMEKWEAVGAAVEEADPYQHPTTNHLCPNMNWRALHHSSAWHDFHMIQTGHHAARFAEISALPAAYRRLQPQKPLVNGEPLYELNPDLGVTEGPHFNAYHTRYAFWVGMLSGTTMGHTYGGLGVWNWHTKGDSRDRRPFILQGPTWEEALHLPGAEQVAIGGRLLGSLPWWSLEPRPEAVELEPAPAKPTAMAACAATSDVWVIYLPEGGAAAVVKNLPAWRWHARWFDPRNGVTHEIGEVGLDAWNRWWRAPMPPSLEDWVLVIARCR